MTDDSAFSVRTVLFHPVHRASPRFPEAIVTPDPGVRRGAPGPVNAVGLSWPRSPKTEPPGGKGTHPHRQPLADDDVERQELRALTFNEDRQCRGRR